MFPRRLCAHAGPGEQHIGMEDLVLELLWSYLPMEDVLLSTEASSAANVKRVVESMRLEVQGWSGGSRGPNRLACAPKAVASGAHLVAVVSLPSHESRGDLRVTRPPRLVGS